MRVLYISKAMVVASYRSKLRCLARDLTIRAVVPRHWPPHGVEPALPGETWLQGEPVRFAGRPHLHFYPRLGQVLDTFHPDLVHVDEEPYSLVSAFALNACRRRHIPAVLFAAQNIYKRLPPPFNLVRRYALHRLAGAMAGTDAAGDVLRRVGYRGRLTVIPQLGVDELQFRPDAARRAAARAALQVGDGTVVVGFGGRLVRYKAINLLLEAMARTSDVVLAVAGDGPERAALARQARTLGLAGRVRFQGYYPSGAMPEWLAGLDLLVLPSISTRSIVEQFGRILIEAMACEVPVLGSRSGGIPGVIGDAGLLVPEGDVAALAAAISRLAAAPAERRALGRAGRERVLAQFTQQRIADDTRQFYAEVLA
ncbi:MAG TPA: glycosyltransferase [Gemmatimonadales bacterium]